MAASAQSSWFPHFHRLFGVGTVLGLSEWQLLERYVAQGDQAAFEAILSRHGPTVLGVCRRVLADPHDIEDAFQATFLVLVRKARTLRPIDVLGPWLYGVAYRVALRMRAMAVHRRAREQPGADLAAYSAPGEKPGLREIRRLLEEEISRLPDRYRKPLVLCYFEGHTHDEAARALAWPLGTVKGRLARARERLRVRLARRGIAASTSGLLGHLHVEARGSVPDRLRHSTLKSTTALGPGGVLKAGAFSSTMTALTEGVLRTMWLSNLKVAAVVLVAVSFAGAGALLRGAQPGGNGASQKRSAAATATPKGVAAQVQGEAAEAPVEKLGLARQHAAEEAFHAASEAFRAGKAGWERLPQLSRNWLDAQRALALTQPERITGYRGHLERMKQLEAGARSRAKSGQALASEAIEAEYYRREAEFWLARACRGQTAAGASPDFGPGAHDPRSQAILAKLDETVPISFPDDTPLEDVLKYIQAATQGPRDSIIPIYVDPVGLQEAEKTLQSPVRLDVEGVPLRLTLRLLLQQLRLRYKVEDGLLMIVSSRSRSYTLAERLEEARRGNLDTEEMTMLIGQLKQLNELEKLRLELGDTLGP